MSIWVRNIKTNKQESHPIYKEKQKHKNKMSLYTAVIFHFLYFKRVFNVVFLTDLYLSGFSNVPPHYFTDAPHCYAHAPHCCPYCYCYYYLTSFTFLPDPQISTCLGLNIICVLQISCLF